MNSNISFQRLLFLDSLRGIAALYVALFHFYSILKQKTDFALPYFFDRILLEGSMGVQIFFVLSGFVIAYSIYRQNITPKFLARFFIRRSIRLDPPYWMTILLTFSVAWFSVIFFTKPADTLPSWGELAANFFYLQDFLQSERVIHVSWTLCLEIQLYLFFVAFIGLLLWIQKSTHFQVREKIFDAPLFLVPLATLFFFSIVQNLNFFALQQVPGLFIPYWYNFFVGSLLCWVYVKAISVRYFWLSCVLMAMLLLIEPNKAIGETLVIALIIYGVSLKGGLHRFLAFEPFQYLGKISYSLYLTHWLFAGKLMDALARRYAEQVDMAFGMGLLLLSLVVALLTAHFFYRWIELPSLIWSRNWFKIREAFGVR